MYERYWMINNNKFNFNLCVQFDTLVSSDLITAGWDLLSSKIDFTLYAMYFLSFGNSLWSLHIQVEWQLENNSSTSYLRPQPSLVLASLEQSTRANNPGISIGMSDMCMSLLGVNLKTLLALNHKTDAAAFVRIYYGRFQSISRSIIHGQRQQYACSQPIWRRLG